MLKSSISKKHGRSLHIDRFLTVLNRAEELAGDIAGAGESVIGGAVRDLSMRRGRLSPNFVLS